MPAHRAPRCRGRRGQRSAPREPHDKAVLARSFPRSPARLRSALPRGELLSALAAPAPRDLRTLLRRPDPAPASRAAATRHPRLCRPGSSTEQRAGRAANNRGRVTHVTAPRQPGRSGTDPPLDAPRATQRAAPTATRPPRPAPLRGDPQGRDRQGSAGAGWRRTRPEGSGAPGHSPAGPPRPRGDTAATGRPSRSASAPAQGAGGGERPGHRRKEPAGAAAARARPPPALTSTARSAAVAIAMAAAIAPQPRPLTASATPHWPQTPPSARPLRPAPARPLPGNAAGTAPDWAAPPSRAAEACRGGARAA